MSPIGQALCNTLLAHQRSVCRPTGIRPADVPAYVITYSQLCHRAGFPEAVRSVGYLLRQVAQWCLENHWPPLNALAVSRDTGLPWIGYGETPGCSIMNWLDEAAACIAFTGYPVHAPESQLP